MASSRGRTRERCCAGVGLRPWRQMIVTLAALLLASQPAMAAPANATQARKAVQGWLRMDGKPLKTPLGTSVARVDTFSDAQGQPAYHIIYLDPCGFVIVSADDEVEPIIGFVAGGTFDPSPDNPLGALVSRDLPGRLEAARTLRNQRGGPAQLGVKAGKWQELLQAGDGIAMYGIASISGISDVRVGPLVASRWNQGDDSSHFAHCYNYYTPSNYPCGCVATAMSQLMRYYQFPTTGIGVRTFSIKVDNVSQNAQTRGGDGAGGSYNWSLMVLDPTSSTSDAQRQAIGALCYDAGLSVNMEYASDASGARNIGEAALTSTFGYSNAIRGYYSSGLAVSDLIVMINPNLDAGFPALLGIRGTAGGHAVVADGYGYSSATLYHHLNMGWGSYQDAWYNLPTIDSAWPGPFTTIFECGYNIYVTGSGEIISGRVLDPAGIPVAGATVTAQRSGGGTYTATTDAKGIYALAKVPSSSSYTISVSGPAWVFLPKVITTGISGNTAGNRWGVDFAGQMPSPPTATYGVASAHVGQTVAIPLQATDDGYPQPGTLQYIIVSLPAHGQLSDPNGGTISTVPHTLADGGNEVHYASAARYAGTDSFTFKASDGGTAPGGGDSNVATVSIDVHGRLIYTASMDANPSWTFDSGWAWGPPSGGGSHNRDPGSGYTGQNVIGYNLAGDYARNLSAKNATTPSIDCTGYVQVKLGFWRWLGVAASPANNAAILVSRDGTTWTNVWSNPATVVQDSTWQYLEYDISAVADNQPSVRVRWVMGSTNSSSTYPGWNIDDVEVIGNVPILAGDINADGYVDVADLLLVASSWSRASGDSGFDLRCDLNGDDRVNVVDLLILADNWGK